MRASDAERERIAEALREAVAEGRLTMEEFEERLEAAYKARTHGELEPLVRDLPAPGGGAAVSLVKSPGAAAAPAAAADWASRIGGGPVSGPVAIGVMGGFQRKGTWTVPRRFTAFAFWGGGEIDLREARFEDGEVVIRCIAIMGGMQVTVPPDLDVHVGGVGIMGGFDDKASGAGTPGSPRVRVTGFAFWGGVGVDRKATKAERRRLREERREERRLAREERRGELE
ncbi:DUF1707 SHOCT-like domain-containing protein [Streptomyces nondiastaticus]|uniref:DUF1707 SHOCT-like domain-containing protein n=1 Tax=Streptomyces nondiastaticus TaxID=3154512 RepID=UPI003F4DB5E2